MNNVKINKFQIIYGTIRANTLKAKPLRLINIFCDYMVICCQKAIFRDCETGTDRGLLSCAYVNYAYLINTVLTFLKDYISSIIVYCGSKSVECNNDTNKIFYHDDTLVLLKSTY